MSDGSLDFSSDNAAGVADEIVAAIVKAASGRADSYGADHWTERLQRAFSDVFGRDVAVFALVTGTAANSLALATAMPSYGAVLCHKSSHVNQDECGAAGFFSHGGRIVGLDGTNGKLSPQAVRDCLATMPKGDVHRSQASALSLTQATECGTVYRSGEISALSGIAREAGMLVHMDGARFANAMVHLGGKPAEVTWLSGVDVLSFGATKGGAMGAEALVYFNPARIGDLAFRRKQSGHLLSKMRFVSAQLLAFLENDLWLRLAGKANAMAQRLAQGLGNIQGVTLAWPVEANEVFADLPESVLARLRAAGARFYEWGSDHRPGTKLVRLVTAFDTTADDVDTFIKIASFR